MAWLLEERCCPSCGYQERVLIVLARENGFRLSCGWCAFLSDPMEAEDAFFRAWGAPETQVGEYLDLVGVPHWQGGRLVESVPIRVLRSRGSALVMERKEVA